MVVWCNANAGRDRKLADLTIPGDTPRLSGTVRPLAVRSQVTYDFPAMVFRVARLVSLVAIVGVVGLAGLEARSDSADWSPVIQTLPTPAAIDSGQPQLTTSNRGVILSWIERSGSRATLKFAERTPQGWTVPRVVASGDDWFVNWADVPSVVRLADDSLAAHWLQKSGPDTYAYDVRLSYSRDDGKTWSRSFTPHHDGTKTEHGFASLFQMPDGGLGLAWLDGRAMKPESTHDAHSAQDRGAMSVRFGTFDGAWKPTSEMPVDLRVCECCPTTAAVTSGGPIVAFRNRSEDEIRDIYISRLESGAWTEPMPVHNDGWKIPACPVNGPMLSARGRDVVIAWFTVREDQGRAFAAFSKDAGRTFGSPIRLDDGGSLGRVDIEWMPDGAAVASWVEFADQRAQFRMRRVDPSGTKSAAVTIAGLTGNRSSGYPRVALYGGEITFAWTESAYGRLQVKTAVARTPASTSARR